MRKFLLPFLFTSFLAPTAFANDYLNFYTGYFDITQDDDSAVQVGVEYRYEDIYYGLRPGIGVNVTDDEAVYGYAGLFWDIYLSDSWVFTPNMVAGAFTHGDGKDLGHGIQFRSGLELSYEFPRQNRLGLAFNHISNASLGDANPGAETLLLIYQHPINWSTDYSRKGQRWKRPEGYQY